MVLRTAHGEAIPTGIQKTTLLTFKTNPNSTALSLVAQKCVLFALLRTSGDAAATGKSL